MACEDILRDQIGPGSVWPPQREIPSQRNGQQNGRRYCDPAPRSGGFAAGMAQRGANTILQAGGRAVIGRVGSNRAAQFQKLRMHPGASAATRKMLRDLGPLGRIQLVVEIGLQQAFCRCASHLETSFIRADRQSLKRRRARDSRDMTVPIGKLAASAISLYGISSISRITTISRNSTGSSSMQSCKSTNLEPSAN